MNPESTIEEVQERLEVEKSEGTARRYAGCQRNWIAWCQDNDIDYSEASEYHVKKFIRYLIQEDYATETISVTKTAVNAFYDKLQELSAEGLSVEPPEENPVEDVTLADYTALKGDGKKAEALREDVYYLTPEEVGQLCENVGSPSLRNRLIIRLLFQTGIRRGELTRIRLKDIDRDEREIQVRATKTSSNRTVYYQPSLDDLLSLWINVDRDAVKMARESEYLFPSPENERLADYTITRLVKTAAENAGLQETLYVDKNGNQKDKIGAHTLRHSYAVASLKNGMSVRHLQKLLGHSSIETTEMYLDLAKTDLQDSARKFGAGTQD